MAAGIVATLRRHSDVVLGNVIGSNIFNLTMILGLTAIVEPIEVNPHIRMIDAPVMLGASLALLVLLFAGKRIPRVVGAMLLGVYAVYIAQLF